MTVTAATVGAAPGGADVAEATTGDGPGAGFGGCEADGGATTAAVADAAGFAAPGGNGQAGAGTAGLAATGGAGAVVVAGGGVSIAVMIGLSSLSVVTTRVLRFLAR